MKKAFALIGLFLLLIPVVTIQIKMNGIRNAEDADQVVSSLYGIMGGLTQGFFGLMVVGFVCDAGKGYKKKWILNSMVILGIAWILRYPSGWMLGVPLVIYSGEKLFHLYRKPKESIQSELDNA